MVPCPLQRSKRVGEHTEAEAATMPARCSRHGMCGGLFYRATQWRAAVCSNNVFDKDRGAQFSAGKKRRTRLLQ